MKNSTVVIIWSLYSLFSISLFILLDTTISRVFVFIAWMISTVWAMAESVQIGIRK